MDTQASGEILIADRIWIATALLHQQFCSRADFTKDEIRRKLDAVGLSDGVKSGTLSAHLDQHCVANVPPSSGKYRMLYETTPGGNLRLFRPGDFTFQGRMQGRKLSKSVPKREDLPQHYWPLLDWYESWCKETRPPVMPINWEDDPLIRLIGSGKHIWADEHADEYVENLRREEPA
ncbi:MAG: hypothetical protein ABSC48_10300 [Terracidiphilus sp.]|jgi:hypothetical protein